MSRLYIIEELMERTQADRMAPGFYCVFDGKNALYNISHLHDKFGGDVDLCGSCLRKYDKGQIKI
ncbi:MULTISPECIES: hypothetical protein [unclassified Spiroplasma]|uniref:hypothetical protein n=1 Tax=unclassified Spiroplasma TaxID=2637901 RepID=UPI0030CD7490